MKLGLDEPHTDDDDKAAVQLSVGFMPAVAELLEKTAKDRGRTASSLISEAVESLLEEIARTPDASLTSVLGREPRRYTYQLPHAMGLHPTERSSDGHRGPSPQYTHRLASYVSKSVGDDLDALCRSSKMSRAGMVRLAVDKYLFNQFEELKKLFDQLMITH